MATLASLVVDLQVQHAHLKRGLDEANAKLDSFTKQAKSLGKEFQQAFRLDVLKEAGQKLA